MLMLRWASPVMLFVICDSSCEWARANIGASARSVLWVEEVSEIGADFFLGCCECSCIAALSTAELVVAQEAGLIADDDLRFEGFAVGVAELGAFFLCLSIGGFVIELLGKEQGLLEVVEA